MCDYDIDWETTAERTITSRIQHQCSCCTRSYSRGTTLVRRNGIQDGERGVVTYACPTCEFATVQRDHSPLHLCWGWSWTSGDGDVELHDAVRFDYLAAELAAGREPTAEGAVAAVRASLLAEAGDDEEARADAMAWTWPTAGAYA
jgi:hypothetical protein